MMPEQVLKISLEISKSRLTAHIQKFHHPQEKPIGYVESEGATRWEKHRIINLQLRVSDFLHRTNFWNKTTQVWIWC